MGKSGKEEINISSRFNKWEGAFNYGIIMVAAVGNNNKETEVISFSDISTLMNKVIEKGYLAWQMEQTKEA